MIILPDQTALSPDNRASLQKWVERGGMLVRFAGERLSSAPDDTLVPARLRQGDRILGGALSWAQPTTLDAFPSSSPFAGLPVPKDIHVQRQVLAEPAIDLGSKTWARLADGTPLVTGAKTGQGYLVLFHVSANAEWSDLALSGLFVQMLDRLVDLAAGAPAGDVDALKPLPPVAMLDGFGRLAGVPAGVLPISAKELQDSKIGPQHPPGFYGESKARLALNLSGAVKTLQPLGIAAQPLTRAHTVDFKPWLLAAAFLLLIGDLLIALALRGLLIRPTVRGVAAGAAAVLFAVLLIAAPGARAAEESDEQIIAATQAAHLAYVRTGAPEGRCDQPRRLEGADRSLVAADLGRCRGSGRRRSRDRRPHLLSPALLADQRQPEAAFARGGRPAEQVSGGRRAHLLRHRRPERFRSLRQRRPGRHAAPGTDRGHGHPAAGAGAGRSRSDSRLLSAEGFPRPLDRRLGLGRSLEQPVNDGVLHRRGRQQRLRQRLGDRRLRPGRFIR